MVPALVLAALFFVIPRADSGQAPSVLHITASLIDAEQKTTPVPHHALLVSDNPTSAPPRRVVTALDGTAELKLRPGSYTVESDRPVVFHGKAYQWTQMVEIVAGRDAVLELTADNAEVGPAGSMTATSAAPLESDPALLVLPWQDSVVALWTPTAHASGFVIDARGLIATNQRVVGKASSVEVQLTPDLKVAARVLAADPVRNVAVALDRSEGHRVSAARADGVRRNGEAARRERAADLHYRRSIPSAEGHDIWNRQPRGAACPRVRPFPRVRQRGWAGLHGHRRRGRDHVGRGRES